jgi:hypothetical protein
MEVMPGSRAKGLLGQPHRIRAVIDAQQCVLLLPQNRCSERPAALLDATAPAGRAAPLLDEV